MESSPRKHLLQHSLETLSQRQCHHSHSAYSKQSSPVTKTTTRKEIKATKIVINILTNQETTILNSLETVIDLPEHRKPFPMDEGLGHLGWPLGS